MRLDKYVASATGCTRSESKALIKKGRVTMGGAICKNTDHKIGADDIVCVDGKALSYREFVYLMLNKPKGVVSASTDRHDITVVDLVQDAYPRRELFPAGRLDKTSIGFVLLTDDGTFAHDILSPRHHVSKTYTVTLDAPLTDEMRRGFASGVTLIDGTVLSPATVSALDDTGLIVRVVLHQGVYHQIKRMFGVYDVGVNELHRDAIGNLWLDENLLPGEWREITSEELSYITSTDPDIPNR
jgi:16S rRNA pseudouridine516 synthase